MSGKHGGLRMRRKQREIWGALTVLALCVSLFCGVCFSQEKIGQSWPSPSQESFVDKDGLIAFSFIYTKRTYQQCSTVDSIKIYNDDSSLWYEFGFCIHNPLFYGDNPKPGFKPFYLPELRVKGVSKNWYRVVVNEDTQDTKYMPMDNPAAAYVPIEHFVLDSGYITFDRERNELRDKPDGKVIEIDVPNNKHYFPKKIDGEWLFVTNDDPVNKHSGWIRWRNGREFLIGFELNHMNYFKPQSRIKFYRTYHERKWITDRST